MTETPLDRGLPATTRLGAASRTLVVAWAWVPALLLIVVVGFALRWHGNHDWDRPGSDQPPLHMHPDERFLSIVSDKIEWPRSFSEYFDTHHSRLNPYNQPETPSYVYGTLPLFLGKAVSTVMHDDNAGRGDSYDTTVKWGRKLSVVFDTATIAVVAGIGITLFSRKAGLLASLCYALAVLPTQLAHFWAVDPYLVFFGALSLWLSLLLVQSESEVAGWFLGMGLGISLGFGVASKVTGVLFIPLLPAAVAMRIALRDIPRLGLRWKGRTWLRGTPRGGSRGHWMTDISVLCLALAAGIFIFRVAQPYAFSGPHIWDMGINPQWRTDVFEGELDRQAGEIDVPYLVQFAGRAPFLYPLENLVLYGLGPALAVAGFAAAAAGGVLLFRRRELTYLLPLLPIVIVFAAQGGRFVTYLRYFAPMYPALCLFAGWGLAALWASATKQRAVVGDGPAPPRSWLARGRAAVRPGSTPLRLAAGYAVLLVLAATAWWALAFQSVYGQENPRIAASKWIYANLPPGSRITGEYWDDTLPYPWPGSDFDSYHLVQTAPYDTDSPAKVLELVYGSPPRPGAASPDLFAGLNGADYVALSSNRVRASVERQEREYPATIRYYQLLDSGALGFDLVARFTVHPTFLGLSVDDTYAEESFTVYDHPEVRIYKKSSRWDAARAVALLDEAHPERAVNLLPKQGRTNGLLETAAEARTQEAGGTFSDVFARDGASDHLPWLWWILWLEVAAFATLPWLSWLLRALPDRGYGLSKIAGFAGVGLTTWLLVAWGGPHFSGTLAWAVLGGFVAAGVVCGVVRRASVKADFKDRWRSWLALEAIFLIAFTAFLLLRYANPDLWHGSQGGEKPIELAFLTAVSRSTIMPPYDPWFAGGTMNYYYMGWFLLAVPMRALKIVPEVGFNLGVPTYAALGAATAASTAHNLVALASRRASPGGGGGIRRRLRPSWRPAVLAAFFGAILFAGIGNLDGAQQTIERLQSVSSWHIDSTLVVGSSHIHLPFVGGVVSFCGGLFEALVHGRQLPPFDWWRSSRVHIGQFDITEFPYWSALFADLHAHLMGQPVFGLVIALAVAYVASATAGLRAQSWALAVVIGVALGLDRTVHTWDFPTSVLLSVAAVGAGQVLAPGRWQARWWAAAGHLAIAVAVLTVAFAPYTAHSEVFQSGLERTPETTFPNQYVAHFGVFLCFAIAFLAVRYWEELRLRPAGPGRNPILATVAGRWEVLALLVFIGGVTAFTWKADGLALTLHLNKIPPGVDESAGRHTLTVLALSAILLIYLANLIWIEWRAPVANVPRLLATAMFAAAIGIAAGVDVVVVKDDIVRMNTVFKFSLQAWQLYALASAFAGWYVACALWHAEGWRVVPRPGRHALAFATTAAGVLLLFGASIYVWSGTRARQEARFGPTAETLDGLRYMDRATYLEDHGTPAPSDDVLIHLADDERLIRWLRENVQGTPVVVEAVGPLYHWTGRISVNTGLPAVVGWDWHEIQQRWDYAALVQSRRSDTSRFYTDPSLEFGRAFLQKYNVRYVVVGTEELAFGTPEGIAKFTSMPELREAFRSGPYAIYQVVEPSSRGPGSARAAGSLAAGPG